MEDGTLTLAPQRGLWCGAPARPVEVGPPQELSVQVSVRDTLIWLLCRVLRGPSSVGLPLLSRSGCQPFGFLVEGL